MTAPSTWRLLTAVRRIRHHAETVAGMCRRVEQELARGEDADTVRLEKKVRAIESRALGLARQVGVIPQERSL